MTIGERIKTLRKKNDMTQETLANYLGVSYQAISKWECDLTCPDLSLIRPLTRLLHVTADELLGLSDELNDTRKTELEAKHKEACRVCNISERYRISSILTTEYPEEIKYFDWLAWETGMRSFEFEENETYIAEQEKAIRLFAHVIENTNDIKIKCSSIGGIVQYLSFRGRHEEAKRYAKLYPDDQPFSKDMIVANTLIGEEKVQHNQKMLLKQMHAMLNTLGWTDIDSCNAIITILQTMFPDENYLYYHGYLSCTQRHLAKLYAQKQDFDRAICMLKKAHRHAALSDEFDRSTQIHRFTSHFFDRVEINPAELFTDAMSMAGLYEAMDDKVFDPIRNNSDFISLLG